MLSQWKDILLNFDSRVVHAADAASIMMLQSRAPTVSKEDRSFLEAKFNDVSLFPLLTYQTLRQGVKRAVFRQGPILTVTTLQIDIRVLKTRILQPLRPVLGRMRTKEKHTVQNKLLPRFEKKYAEYQPIPKMSEREFARRCYERLFLHLLRGTSPARPLDQADIQSIADEECFQSGRESIEAKVGGDELAVDKRHRPKLFKNSSATAALLPVMIRQLHPFCCSVNAAFMVKHLASLFLCGTPALLSPTWSPATSLIDSCETALDLPHHLPLVNCQLPTFSSSASCSPGAETTLTRSDCAWSDSTQHIAGDHSLEPRLMTFLDFKSVCASVVGGPISNCRSSAKSINSNQEGRKRPLALCNIIAQEREHKRP